MNGIDFKDWYRKHRAAFPSIDAWLGGLCNRRSGDAPLTEAEVLRTWHDALRDVALADAIAATQRLVRGDEEPPKSFDDHPRTIRRIAHRLSGARLRETHRRDMKLIDGQPVYDCHLCSDTGMRTVWHSKSVEAMHAGKYIAAGNRGCTELTAAVKCGCQRGQLIRIEGMETFSDARHLEYDPRDLEREAKLRDFAHRGPVAVPFDPVEDAWK